MKLIIQVYENLTVEITINAKNNSYTFKTPKAFGGRFYYSFCNDLDNAFEERFPEIYRTLNKNK